MTVKEHNKCKCLCKKTAADCNSRQKFIKSQCRCECTNSEEAGQCAQVKENFYYIFFLGFYCNKFYCFIRKFHATHTYILHFCFKCQHFFPNIIFALKFIKKNPKFSFTLQLFLESKEAFRFKFVCMCVPRYERLCRWIPI